MAETVVHQVRRIAARKACPGPFAGDVSAVQDAGHWDAIHDLHQEEVRDCQWEAGRDFLSATDEPEHLILLASRGVRARRPRDEWLTAVSPKGPPAAQAQRVVLRALLALQQAHADESELLQAQWLPVQQASRPAAQLQVQESAPWARPEQRLRALRGRSALPLAQQEPQARSVSLRLALRSIVEPAPVQQVSSARPSLPLPSLLCPLWRPLPPALLLQRRLESFCEPSPRRPRGSSSSASSFP